MTSYTGRCACGAVSATVAADPIAIRQCWCRQCQKIAAGSATTNAIFPTEAIAMTGALDTWDYVAASGNTLTHSRCAVCGTPVISESSARPQYRVIRLGFLDPPHDLRPTTVIWTEEAPDWAPIDAAAEAHRRQPPPPPEIAPRTNPR